MDPFSTPNPNPLGLLLSLGGSEAESYSRLKGGRKSVLLIDEQVLMDTLVWQRSKKTLKIRLGIPLKFQQSGGLLPMRTGSPSWAWEVQQDVGL